MNTIVSEIGIADWYEIDLPDNYISVLAVCSKPEASGNFPGSIEKAVHDTFSSMQRVFDAEFVIEQIRAFTSIYELAHADYPKSFHGDVVCEDPIVERVLRYLRTHYAQDISLAKAADRAYLSPGYFSRYVKDRTGKTFTEHLTHIRIQKSIELLQRNTCSIGEIGALVGYPNSCYFSRVSRSQTRFSPRQYRTQVLAREPDSD